MTKIEKVEGYDEFARYLTLAAVTAWRRLYAERERKQGGGQVGSAGGEAGEHGPLDGTEFLVRAFAELQSLAFPDRFGAALVSTARIDPGLVPASGEVCRAWFASVGVPADSVLVAQVVDEIERGLRCPPNEERRRNARELAARADDDAATFLIVSSEFLFGTGLPTHRQIHRTDRRRISAWRDNLMKLVTFRDDLDSNDYHRLLVRLAETSQRLVPAAERAAEPTSRALRDELEQLTRAAAELSERIEQLTPAAVRRLARPDGHGASYSVEREATLAREVTADIFGRGTLFEPGPSDELPAAAERGNSAPPRHPKHSSVKRMVDALAEAASRALDEAPQPHPGRPAESFRKAVARELYTNARVRADGTFRMPHGSAHDVTAAITGLLRPFGLAQSLDSVRSWVEGSGDIDSHLEDYVGNDSGGRE